MGKLTELVNEMTAKHKKTRKNCQGNIIIDLGKELLPEPKTSPLEEKLKDLQKKPLKGLSEQGIDLKVGSNYQVNMHSLRMKISNIGSKSGGIDVVTCQAVNRESGFASVRWPNGNVELISVKDILTIV